jgi:hypothetical protein
MSVFFEISSYPSWEMPCHLFLSVRSSAFLMLGMNVERADQIAPTIGRQWNDVLGILKRQGARLILATSLAGPMFWMCGTSSSELSLGLGSDGPEGLFSRVSFWLSCCTPQFRLMYCLYPCAGSVEKLGLNERALRVGLGDHRSSPSIFPGGDLPLHTSYARWCVLAACIPSGLTTTPQRLP